MELKVFRDTLSAAGSFCTVKSEIPIETEILISDYLPQVFKIVKCFARMVVLQKQIQNGRLNLEGYLRCIVYYQGENDQGLCQTEQKLPFSKSLELPKLEFSSFSTVVGGEIEYLNCRAVNQRRVEVRGAYEVAASIYTQLQQEIVTAVADHGAEQKQEELSGVRCLAGLDKILTADGEFTFAQQPAAILDIAGTASVRELKIISGKVVAKGEIHAELAYRTGQDNILRGQQVTVPFNQILDIDGISEDCRCFCTVEPMGFTVTEETTDEPGASRMTATALLHLRAYRDYQMMVVTDLFSTQYETQIERREIAVEWLRKPLDETLTLSAGGQLPDENAKPLACFASFGASEIAPVDGKASLRTRGVVTAFCENSLNEIESYEKPVELVIPLADTDCCDRLHAECWLTVQDVACTANGGALDVTVTVQAEGVVLERRTIDAVSGAALREPHTPADPEIALRIYYAQSGEEVFEIARRFHVSPRDMRSANQLEEETLSAARRLLVPGVG